MMYIRSAKVIINMLAPVEYRDCIEVSYRTFTPGIGYTTKTSFVYSTPLGNWTEIKFTEDNVKYSNFLNTMVYKNLEVRRLLAIVALRDVLSVFKYNIKLLNAMAILDPTFVPPNINLSCRWQCEMVDEIVNKSSFHVISTCRNEYRLTKYFNALQALEV